jgi:cytochrome c oxidase subunit 2
MAMLNRLLIYISSAALLAVCGPALAGDGQPSPWQMGFQKAASPIMEQITSFHDFVNIIIVLIALFVLGLLIYVMVRFNEKRHPQPSRTTHNTMLEVAWTIIPVLILVAIAIPSFRLLFAQYDFPKADLTITATGSQWYWTYEYPDHGITFASIIVQDADLKPGQPRLLTVDHEVVVPVNKNVIVQVKANDVIHDWAVPSFGQDRCGPRQVQRHVQGRAAGMFRSVLGLRPQSCLHADRVRVVSDEDFVIGSTAQEERARRCRQGDDGPELAGARLSTRDDGRRQGRQRWQHKAPMPKSPMMHIQPDGDAGSFRPTTKTSARCISSSPWLVASSAAFCRWLCAPSSWNRACSFSAIRKSSMCSSLPTD